MGSDQYSSPYRAPTVTLWRQFSTLSNSDDLRFNFLCESVSLLPWARNDCIKIIKHMTKWSNFKVHKIWIVITSLCQRVELAQVLSCDLTVEHQVMTNGLLLFRVKLYCRHISIGIYSHLMRNKNCNTEMSIQYCRSQLIRLQPSYHSYSNNTNILMFSRYNI